MGDFESLLELVKEHRKHCFHKSKCEICKVSFEKGESYQCDNCGGVYNNQYYPEDIKCFCGKQTVIVCTGHECDDIANCMEFVDYPERDDEGYWCVYRDVCCPITKGAK